MFVFTVKTWTGKKREEKAEREGTWTRGLFNVVNPKPFNSQDLFSNSPFQLLYIFFVC